LDEFNEQEIDGFWKEKTLKSAVESERNEWRFGAAVD
jgi:hypothetical protein